MATGQNINTYFQGTWHKGNAAVISAADHGAWLGSNVFDGARYFNGVAPDLLAHCERVNNSAQALMLKPTVSSKEMVDIIWEGLKLYPADAAVYIRPMYWAIDGDLSAIVPKDAVVNAKAGCLYPNNARMLVEARSKGFDNALVADAMGNVAETATANIFMVRDGEVFTPVANGTFLAGITRSRHISNLKEIGQNVQETVLSFQDFETADEVFMSGNMNKVTPVTAFNERQYQVGPMTRKVREMYWDWATSL